MSDTFYLSTLNLSTGTYDITVKARASGYTDSPASETVNFTFYNDPSYSTPNVTWAIKPDADLSTLDAGVYPIQYKQYANVDDLHITSFAYLKVSDYDESQSDRAKVVTMHSANDTTLSNGIEMCSMGHDGALYFSHDYAKYLEIYNRLSSVSNGYNLFVWLMKNAEVYTPPELKGTVWKFNRKLKPGLCFSMNMHVELESGFSYTHSVMLGRYSYEKAFDGIQYKYDATSDEYSLIYKGMLQTRHDTDVTSSISKTVYTYSVADDDYRWGWETLLDSPGYNNFNPIIFADTTASIVIENGSMVRFIRFYDCLRTNAVRQTITFTIDGTSYKALSGMTWGEWVESEYNTGGFYIENTVAVHVIKNSIEYYVTNDRDSITVRNYDIIEKNQSYSLQKWYSGGTYD